MGRTGELAAGAGLGPRTDGCGWLRTQVEQGQSLDLDAGQLSMSPAGGTGCHPGQEGHPGGGGGGQGPCCSLKLGRLGCDRTALPPVPKGRMMYSLRPLRAPLGVLESKSLPILFLPRGSLRSGPTWTHAGLGRVYAAAQALLPVPPHPGARAAGGWLQAPAWS